MANKKVSQLTSKPAVNLTDLFLIADPTSGQAFKTTISDLGTAIGSGVSSVNTLVGAVVLDTDDIQELASPTNRWFTDTRARAALSASSPLAYNSGTGAFGIQVANGSQNGYLSSTDWTTFNNKLSTATAAATYVPYTGATNNVNLGNNDITAGSFTGGTASFATSGAGAAVGINHSSGAGIALNISKSGSGEGIYVNKTSGTGNAVTIIGTLNATTIVKNGGTSSQYLMADGSVSTLTNPVTGTGTSGIVAKFNGTSSVTDSIIYDNGTRVSIGADVTTSNKFTAVASTTSSYAVVAQASGAANGFWATLSGTGEIFRGQTSGGSYFIINNGGNAFLNGNLNVGDFASTSYKLKVNGTANFTDDVTFDGGIGAINFSASTTITNTASSGYTAIYANGGGIYLGGSASTNHLTITSAGNVGIGTTAPSAKLHVVGSIYQSDAAGQIASNTWGVYNGGSTTMDFVYNSAGAVLWIASGSEKLRFTGAGTLLINKTTQSISNTKFELLQDTNNHASYWSVSSGTGNAIFYQRLDNTANYYSFFTYGASLVGSINTNGTTTSYNISSDYRLKEDLKPINGLEIVNKIKVYDYKWKSHDSRMDGVLAHELAEVLPYAVSGIKDGEQMQGVDYSKIVPVMVQAIKDLKLELDTLKNK